MLLTSSLLVWCYSRTTFNICRQMHLFFLNDVLFSSVHLYKFRCWALKVSSYISNAACPIDYGPEPYIRRNFWEGWGDHCFSFWKLQVSGWIIANRDSWYIQTCYWPCTSCTCFCFKALCSSAWYTFSRGTTEALQILSGFWNYLSFILHVYVCLCMCNKLNKNWLYQTFLTRCINFHLDCCKEEIQTSVDRDWWICIHQQWQDSDGSCGLFHSLSKNGLTLSEH